MIERRIKLVAFDVFPGTPIEDISLPVTEEYPEGTRLLAAYPYPLQNCVIGIATHPSFRETNPLERIEADVLLYKEGQ